MGAFSYGFDTDPSASAAPKFDQNNPLGLGGAAGSQVNSQTAGQGAGVTPMSEFQPTYDYGFKDTPGFESGGISGQMQPQVQPDVRDQPGSSLGTMPAQNQPDTQARPQADVSDFSGMLQKVQAATNPQDAAQAQDQLARSIFSALSDAGHDVKWQDGQTLMVDGRAYTVAGSASGSSGARTYSANDWNANVQQPNLPSDLSGWRPGTSPYYTPGDISFEDIPNFTRESLMNELEGGNVNAGTNSLMMNLLNNPTALSDQVVDTLKAQQKNTLAEQQQQEEEDMRGFGAASGISDSNWMANQLAGSRRARDIGISKAAQDVDVAAAQTRMGDKRAAAQLGMQYGQQRSQNIQAATSQALARSAAVGDRQGLRESVKQAAAQLRISQDQVMSNFVLEKEKNLLQKYGLDLGAQIDASKLNEQSAEFKEDLAFKMQQLEQTLGMQGRALGSQENQFAQEMQYKYDVFNQGNADTDWQREFMMSQLGGG